MGRLRVRRGGQQVTALALQSYGAVALPLAPVQQSQQLQGRGYSRVLLPKRSPVRLHTGHTATATGCLTSSNTGQLRTCGPDLQAMI